MGWPERAEVVVVRRLSTSFGKLLHNEEDDVEAVSALKTALTVPLLTTMLMTTVVTMTSVSPLSCSARS